jgi:arylsulfatase A-like enzyme
MIVKWPGMVKPASECSEPVIIEDFFPTLLKMAGIRKYQVPQHVDGRSLVPLLVHKGSVKANRCLFWHYPNKWGPEGPGIGATSTIRRGDWKLIYWYVDQHFELFNIREDIGERHNLSAENPGLTAALAGKLGSYLRQVHAQRPLSRATGKECPWPDVAARRAGIH